MKLIIVLVILFLFVLSYYLYYENTTIQISKYSIKSDKIPNEFNGYIIAQISDFHNSNSNKLNKSIINSLKNESPDIIVITGDFLDAYNPNIDIAISYINQLINIAPIYYVRGNHETRVEDYSVFEKKMEKQGVVILKNEKIELGINNVNIDLIGMDDPSAYITGDMLNEKDILIKEKIDKLIENSGKYKILLCHRPELFNIYVEESIELVFTGHAHGGQIQIPFIGGVFAPNQGFFPKYTNGIYSKDCTNMIVSRGIGKSKIPFRINNRPELIITQLNSI